MAPGAAPSVSWIAELCGGSVRCQTDSVTVAATGHRWRRRRLSFPPRRISSCRPFCIRIPGRCAASAWRSEFIGPTAESIAGCLSDTLGGSVVQEDPHAFRLEGSSLGAIRGVGQPDGSCGTEAGQPPRRRIAEDRRMVRIGGKLFIPCELVTAPIPMDRLHEVDALLRILREAGARGTQDAAVYAAGLHFNPEIARPDAPSAVAILKAFRSSQRVASPGGGARFDARPAGFADPFPIEYARLLAAPDYWPDIPSLIDDYLAFNPTRNRDLDMLPLLLHFDETVRATLPSEKINGRPAFHYRLPDARVSDPGWSVAPDWNRWVAVERLAGDRERLDGVGLAFPGLRRRGEERADVVERIAF